MKSLLNILNQSHELNFTLAEWEELSLGKEVMQFLISEKLITSTDGTVTSVSCSDCDATHELKKDATSNYYFICNSSNGGIVNIKRQEVKIYSFSFPRLCLLLQNGLGARGEISIVEPHSVWFLGWLMHRSLTWSVWYARKTEVLGDVINRETKGIVITSQPELVDYPLPMISLNDLLTVNGKQHTVDKKLLLGILEVTFADMITATQSDYDLVYGVVKINTAKAHMSLFGSDNISIPLDSDPIKLLLALVGAKGAVVKYSIAANDILNLGVSDQEITSDVSRTVQYLRRDLKAVLLNNGFTKESVDRLMGIIQSVRKIGYKLALAA